MRSTDALLNDPDFMSAHQPDDADLEAWVASLREGDLTYRDAIIKGHLRLARAIGKHYGKGIRDDDCIGEAFLALTQAVEWSGPHVDEDGNKKPSRLIDNNITPYICTTVRSFLSDFVAVDRVCGMPGRTFRDKAAKGEISRDGNDGHAIVAVVSVMRLVMSDGRDWGEESGDYDNYDRRSFAPYAVPTARQEEPSAEFNEALSLAIHTETERKIIDLRAQNYGYQEIGGIVGLGTTQVGRYIDRVEKRFSTLYG